MDIKEFDVFLNGTKFDLKNLDYIKAGDTLGFIVKQNNENIAQFYLKELPGCCGVLVSFNALVWPKWRGKGIQTMLNNYRKEIANHLRYTILLCTNCHDNIPQSKVLEKNGWKILDSFINKRTGNKIDLQIFHLR